MSKTCQLCGDSVKTNADGVCAACEDLWIRGKADAAAGRVHDQEDVRAELFKFPTPPREASAGCTRWQLVQSRVREWWGRTLNRLGRPGVVRDVELRDCIVGDLVVKVGAFSTRISINGRDFFFDRLTGKLVGTGMAASAGPTQCRTGPSMAR